MSKNNQSPLQRILRIESFYCKRGQNRELVNEVKRKILAFKFNEKI